MSQALFDLSGRTAFVTGSTRGIGLAVARAGGIIITNQHVVANADQVVVTLTDGNYSHVPIDTLLHGTGAAILRSIAIEVRKHPDVRLVVRGTPDIPWQSKSLPSMRRNLSLAVIAAVMLLYYILCRLRKLEPGLAATNRW